MAETKKKERPTRFDAAFEFHLSQLGVHAEHFKAESIKPRNINDIQNALSTKRDDVSPSMHEDYKNALLQVVNEQNVKTEVTRYFFGKSAIFKQADVLFTDMTPISDSHPHKLPMPDYFDGARPEMLNLALREDETLRSQIIPTTNHSVPVAPSFFFEVKGPNGKFIELKRQACYYAAHGARAMHALQNYGKAVLEYDGAAYSYSAVYNPSPSLGFLTLYAHYIQVSPAKDGTMTPYYYMTYLSEYPLRDENTFCQAVTAFRNLRELAQEQRNAIIKAANARAEELSM